MMPRMDGFELLARLREDPRTRRLPVIMLSARAGEEATVEGLDAGADDYLVKPFSGRRAARPRARQPRGRAAARRARGRRARPGARDGGRRAHAPAQPAAARAARGRSAPSWRAATCRPSESLEIGGDFYDATALGDGRVVITIGDVAGHGVLAAAVMGQVRQAVRAYALRGPSPGRADGPPGPARVRLGSRDDHLPVRDPRPGRRDPALLQRRPPAAADPPRRRHAWTASPTVSATRSASRWPTGMRRRR